MVMAPVQAFHAAIYLAMALVIAYHTPAAAQPTCGGSNPMAICYAAALRGDLSADCIALNRVLTQSLPGVQWSGTCSTTPPVPFNRWPVGSAHQVFYSCLTGLALTSSAGRPAYALLASRVWSVNDVRSSATLTTGLRSMYAGASVPAALWLSFSCQAPRMPSGSTRAIGRFISCTGSSGFLLNPPPPDFGVSPPPPSPPDVLGYSLVGCILSNDPTYTKYLSPDEGNPTYGSVPSVQACAATVRTALRLDAADESGLDGMNVPFGMGPGGFCQAFVAVSHELLQTPHENNTATWVDDSLCSDPCPLGSPGETCGGADVMSVYVLGNNTLNGWNGDQECSLIIRPSEDLPPMLSLSEILLYDTSDTLIDLTSIYGNGSSLNDPGQVPYASMSSWYYDLTLNVTDSNSGDNAIDPNRFWSTNRCFDGSWDTCCATSSCLHYEGGCDNASYPHDYSDEAVLFQDLFPSLTVTYPCPGGHTLGALGRIEIYTCPSTNGYPEDNQPTNINSFQIDYLSANGTQDAATTYFSGPPPDNYTVSINVTLQGIPPPAPLDPEMPGLPPSPPPSTASTPPGTPGGVCSAVIRPTTSFADRDAACNSQPRCAVPLNLAEVQLFGPGGVQLERSTLQFTLSSTYMWHRGNTTLALSADNCNDGVTRGRVNGDGVNPPGDICRTYNGASLDRRDSNPLDPNPSLTISYPCPSGSTSLTRVFVVNREDSAQERINWFTMDFRNQDGAIDAASYTFRGGKANYNITVSVNLQLPSSPLPTSAPPLQPSTPPAPAPPPPPFERSPPSPPAPATAYRCLQDTMMAGRNMAVASSASDEECVYRCAQTVNCQWTSRHASDGLCYLKTGAPLPMQGPDGTNAPAQGVNLCLVPGPPNNAGFLCVSNWDITGIDVSDVMNNFQSSYPDCARACSSNSDCDFVIYTGDGICTLRQRPFSMGPLPGQALVVTGPVNKTTAACFRTS